MPEEIIKTLNVSLDVWKVLQKIRTENNLRKMEDVIKLVLSKYKG